MITSTLCRHQFCWECLTSTEEYQGRVRKGIKKVATFQRMMSDRWDFEDPLLRKLFEDLKDEGVR